jgi:acyl dehydratase
MPQLYWDTIDLGDAVAPLTKPAISRIQIAKFAGAAQDWSPLHIDDDFAKAAGYGSVSAHGPISLGFAVEGVQRWLENGRVLSTAATFPKFVWPGDILTAKGVVVNRYEKNGEPRVDIDVWTENQNHDIVMRGQITCLLWRNDKEEKKARGIWPQVSPETIKERRTAKPVPRSEVDAQKARLEAAQLAHQVQHAADAKKGKVAAKPLPAPAAKPLPAPAAKPLPAPAAKPLPAPAAKAAPAPAPKAPAKPAAAAPKAAPAKAQPAPAKAPAKGAPAPTKAPPAPVKAPTKPAPAKAPAKPAPAKAPAKPAPAKPVPVKAPAKPEKKAEKKPEKKADKKPEKKADKKPDAKKKKK